MKKMISCLIIFMGFSFALTANAYTIILKNKPKKLDHIDVVVKLISQCKTVNGTEICGSKSGFSTNDVVASQIPMFISLLEEDLGSTVYQNNTTTKEQSFISISYNSHDLHRVNLAGLSPNSNLVF